MCKVRSVFNNFFSFLFLSFFCDEYERRSMIHILFSIPFGFSCFQFNNLLLGKVACESFCGFEV